MESPVMEAIPKQEVERKRGRKSSIPLEQREQTRRLKKQDMERRRRACISEKMTALHNLALSLVGEDPTQHQKIEKADILSVCYNVLQGIADITKEQPSIQEKMHKLGSIVREYSSRCVDEITQSSESENELLVDVVEMQKSEIENKCVYNRRGPRGSIEKLSVADNLSPSIVGKECAERLRSPGVVISHRYSHRLSPAPRPIPCPSRTPPALDRPFVWSSSRSAFSTPMEKQPTQQSTTKQQPQLIPFYGKPEEGGHISICRKAFSLVNRSGMANISYRQYMNSSSATTTSSGTSTSLVLSTPSTSDLSDSVIESPQLKELYSNDQLERRQLDQQLLQKRPHQTVWGHNLYSFSSGSSSYSSASYGSQRDMPYSPAIPSTVKHIHNITSSYPAVETGSQSLLEHESVAVRREESVWRPYL